MNASDECAEDIKILERAFTAFAEEYRESSEVWRTLDSKAQGLISAAGLFLAAAFAFSREPSLSGVTKSMVLLTLGLLFWSILAALAVLRAAAFDVPDGAQAVVDARTAVSAPTVPCGERYLKYLEGQLKDAEAILKSLDGVNETKRAKLSTAQKLLALAAFCTVAGTLLNMVLLPNL